MTSHELANKLLDMPDVMVVGRGYEGGVDEITAVDPPAKLHLSVHTEWFYGKHEFHENSFCSYCDNSVSHTTQAIYIG